MPVTPDTASAAPLAGNRQVWVLNRDAKSYVEVFRGDKISVPANSEKAVLMPFLAARRFLGQPKAPAEKDVRGEFTIRPKALYTLELTDEERNENDPVFGVKEDPAEHLCTLCDGGRSFQTGSALKTHLTRMHPDREPVKEV